MNTVVFQLYLLLHILGDFYLQSEKMAGSKKTKHRAVLLHGFVYALPFLVSLVFIQPSMALINSLIFLIILHICIDTIKFLFYNHGKYKESTLYLVDQGVHLISLAAVAIFIKPVPLQPASWITKSLGPSTFPYATLLVWTLCILILAKPSNITIRHIISRLGSKEETPRNNAGAMIGTIERYIMIILLSLGQFGALALVMAAKSISRYEMLKDKDFAEYYLLGTLLSILIVLIVWLLLFL
ncbi:DUF3307 domain-containing protein [Sphaerochaeta halotolerans]|jgi:hypothetical protein|uniref:DUF3307 domain-containing protein n=1 Tax=Sphaerochaeta halotolerans TaxID=2293840 RepID=A0A372MEX2_9SPIR|nr:DUF3307 domain-containing protein [Sphaerochaeta halotolerans]MBG0766764.1 DUF3307 domain-containing protein [Spirochaetaceae bacterium]MXI85897.1 DUF3307 domain-containing protein [Sphaerochaeta halotolerans]RFU94325.1 DUF3307 domain-containing protein [Sphaerochaeta halotolerans]